MPMRAQSPRFYSTGITCSRPGQTEPGQSSYGARRQGYSNLRRPFTLNLTLTLTLILTLTITVTLKPLKVLGGFDQSIAGLGIYREALFIPDPNPNHNPNPNPNLRRSLSPADGVSVLLNSVAQHQGPR